MSAQGLPGADVALPIYRSTDTVRAALLGHENLARFILDAVVTYERGQWEEATRYAGMANIAPESTR